LYRNILLTGNLLYTEGAENGNFVQMIDFEYSSYNYRYCIRFLTRNMIDLIVAELAIPQS